MRELRGKVAVVTGGASGIGRALADCFAAEGMRVVLADIETDPLMAAERELRESGAEVIAVQTDVAKSESIANLADVTLERFGAVHVVCNNAGVSTSIGPVWERSLSDWEWVLGVNLWGVIHGIRTFVPILLRQDVEAHIVNTASISGLLAHPFPFRAPYNTSKHAIVALSETLSHDLELVGSRIGVSVLCPAAVKTKIMDSERNRPRVATQELTTLANNDAQQALRAIIAAGTSPHVVASQVLTAIHQRQLYIFPHQEFAEAVRAHAEDVIAQRNPLPLAT